MISHCHGLSQDPWTLCATQTSLSHTTWWTFSTSHTLELKTSSFHCHYYPWQPTARKNRIMRLLRDLFLFLSNRHWRREKDMCMPRLPCVARSCRTMLEAYHHTCWAQRVLKKIDAPLSPHQGPVHMGFQGPRSQVPSPESQVPLS